MSDRKLKTESVSSSRPVGGWCEVDGRLEVEKSLLRLEVLVALPLPRRLSKIDVPESEVPADVGKAFELADDGSDRIFGRGIGGIGKRGW